LGACGIQRFLQRFSAHFAVRHRKKTPLLTRKRGVFPGVEFETFQDTLVWKTSNRAFNDGQQNATNCNERSHWRGLNLSPRAAERMAVALVLVLEFSAANGSIRELDKLSSQPNHTTMANQPNLKVKEGDLAPGFTAGTQAEGQVSLEDLRGKNVILYFYPRDDTPGCTKEACAFRDDFASFKAKGAVILGVSTDPPKAHEKFAQKYKLPFMLVSDEDKRIVEAYGVWGEKKFMGVKYQGTRRVTFLIGPDGRIKKIWPKVKPAEHAQEVLAALDAGT
jgi:peroxiredoxin Q/BCP